MNKIDGKRDMNIQSLLRKAGACTGLSLALLLGPNLVNEGFDLLGLDSLNIGAEVFAQSKKDRCNKKSKEPRRTPAMSEKVFKDLAKVAALAQPEAKKEGDPLPEPNFPGAKRELDKVKNRCIKNECNKYEMASIYSYMGWVSFSLNDTAGAIKAYELLVAQVPEIPEGLELQTYLTLGKLALQEEKLDISLKYVNKWISASCNVDADIFQLRSNIHYFKDDKVNALKDINRAVKMVEDKGKVVKQPWWNLQKALLLEKEDYRGALPVIIKMIRHYPKYQTWDQLASVYGILEQESNQRHALDALHAMGGFTKESQYINLTYLYLGAEYPYKAAKIMQEGINKKLVKSTSSNLRTLAQAYATSQEIDKSIPVMERAAASADNGDLYAQLVSLYLNKDNFKKAISSGKKAIDKKKLRRAGEVHLNMGIAYFEQKKFESAVNAFKKAKEYDATSRLAENWMRHANSEWERDVKLKEALEG